MMLRQALLQQQPQAAAADASLNMTCAQLEERLREMLGERKLPQSSSPSSSSPVEPRRSSRRSISANVEVSTQRCCQCMGGIISNMQWCSYQCLLYKRPRVTSLVQLSSPMFRTKNTLGLADSVTKASLSVTIEGALLLVV